MNPQEAVKQSGLESLRRSAYCPYPGYPSERFIDCSSRTDMTNIPLGPWDTPGRNEVTSDFAVHPWALDMLADPNIGIVTGKGAYWHWGPNHTVDSIVVRSQNGLEVLLVQRKDTGQWALPGGFIDPGETATEAAVREVREETAINVGRIAAMAVIIYSGPVADARTTIHAWPETTALRFDIFNSAYLPSMEVIAGDDATNARWTPIDEIGELFGSHNTLIDIALNGEI